MLILFLARKLLCLVVFHKFFIDFFIQLEFLNMFISSYRRNFKGKHCGAAGGRIRQESRGITRLKP